MANRPSDNPGSAQAASTPEPLKKINEPALAVAISEIISTYPDHDIGVSLRDIKTGEAYDYGVQDQFIAASISKLLTAAFYLSKVESGEYTLEQNFGDETARSLIEKMIGRSDNDAWRKLNEELGKVNLEAYAHSKGYVSYESADNKIKPAEVSKLLDEIYNTKLLNRAHTDIILTAMKSGAEERQFIRPALAPDITVYHKAGWLKDRAHDTAIVEIENRPYILVVFTKKRFGDYDFAKGQQIFSRLTELSHTSFSSL